MTDWQEMSPLQFDATLAPDAKTRRFVATAPATLFPGLMPEAPAGPTPEPGPLGTLDLFADLSSPGTAQTEPGSTSPGTAARPGTPTGSR